MTADPNIHLGDHAIVCVRSRGFQELCAVSRNAIVQIRVRQAPLVKLDDDPADARGLCISTTTGDVLDWTVTDLESIAAIAWFAAGPRPSAAPVEPAPVEYAVGTHVLYGGRRTIIERGPHVAGDGVKLWRLRGVSFLVSEHDLCPAP